MLWAAAARKKKLAPAADKKGNSAADAGRQLRRKAKAVRHKEAPQRKVSQKRDREMAANSPIAVGKRPEALLVRDTPCFAVKKKGAEERKRPVAAE